MAEALEQFYKWRAEVALLLARLSERLGEAEELHSLVERSDYRDLPRILVRMATLALLEPELRRYLPDVETVKRWMDAERERRLEVVRKYASAAGAGKVVVNLFRWDIGAYEYFALAEVVRPGMSPVCQTLIGGLPAYANKASMTVIGREEFLSRYKGKRLMAVVHTVSEMGEEYFTEELNTEDLAR